MSRLYRRNRDLSRPIERFTLRVEHPEQGRFDAFLTRHLAWRSRAGAQELIRDGRALVNGERRKPSTQLRTGDLVTVVVARPPPAAPPPEPEITVLLEDEHLLALDKESGVVVHPVGVHQQGTLLQELHRRSAASPPGAPPFLPKLIHRIDQYTSGILLVAKSDAVRAAFSEMLARGEVEKVYEALLLGRAPWQERSVDEPIGSVGDSRILMRVDREGGKEARSHFAVRERFAHATHVGVRIETGRTHQIRVHASHLGMPLLGDHLYGDGIALPGFQRFALHAGRIRFRHPVTGLETEVRSPLPRPFVEALDFLRRPPAEGKSAMVR